MLGCPELALKEEQKLAIHAIYSGSDVFANRIWKSMCFHTLPFVFDYKLELVSASKRSVVVVVAPLVALMVDQVQSLRAKGVEAAIVSSGGREGRVAGDLLTSDFQSLISSSLALIEVSVELCQGTHQIPYWSPWSSSNSCSQVATLQCSHAGLKNILLRF